MMEKAMGITQFSFRLVSDVVELHVICLVFKKKIFQPWSAAPVDMTQRFMEELLEWSAAICQMNIVTFFLLCYTQDVKLIRCIIFYCCIP